MPEWRRRRTALTLACLALMTVALAQDGGEAGGLRGEELDTVVIVGERTPPLWKLTRKGHVLWILGTYSPQPSNLQLNTQRLDQLIAGSQELILPGPAYVASPGVSAMHHIVKSASNPGGATLQDLMPAEAFETWLALRRKYSSSAALLQPGPKFAWGSDNARWVVLTEPFRGGDGIDRLRPTLAWEALRRAAMNSHGLTNYDVGAGLAAIAGRHNVPVRKARHGRELMLVWNADPAVERIRDKKEDPEQVIASVDYGDLPCLMDNLDLLEPVMEMQKLQAAAWARGDLAGLNSASGGLRLRDCVKELVAAVSGGRLPGSDDAAKAQERYARAARNSSREVQRHWINAVQDAVRKNKVTFAAAPLDRLVAEAGYLAALRGKGFDLEEFGVEGDEQ